MTTDLAPLRRSLEPGTRSGRLVPVLVSLAIVLFGIAATIVTTRANNEQVAAEQRNLASSVGGSLHDRLIAYSEVLFGVRGAFAIGPSLDRADFSDLLVELDVDERQPGVQVIGVAHVADVEDLDDTERRVNELAAVSGLGYPPFEIYPTPTRDQMLPIDFIDPVVGNERAFGLDFFSEPNRRAAATRARDTGLPSATGPVTLVQETSTQRAFLVMLPMYEQGRSVTTTAERRAAFEGVVYAAFRMGDLMDAVLGTDAPDSVAVFDVESGEILYDRADDFVGAESRSPRTGREDTAEVCPPFCGMPDPRDHRVIEIETSGRTWLVFVAADANALSTTERSVPIITFLGGFLIAGLVGAIITTARSARRRALQLAAEMTGELEALTESADEAIVSVDEEGAIVAWNAAATRTFGASAQTMIGQSIEELTPPDESGLSHLLLDSPTGSNSQLTMGRRIDDGGDFPLELSRSVWTAGGRRFVTLFMRDVTARIDAERELLATGNLLRGVLDAATSMAIIGTDATGTINVFNSGAERLLGHHADAVVGVCSPAVFHDPAEVQERADELGIAPGFEVFVASARLGQTDTRQWTYLHADGHRIPVELTVTPRYDGNCVLCGFIGIAVDITERLDAIDQQQALLDQEREMVAKLTELDQVKNDFVSTISHELRTPLTSIIGYTELLADDGADDLTAQHLEMIEVITRNAERLLLLVEDLLALSRIESGELNANRSPCHVGDIFDAVECAVAPLAAARDISVDYDIADTAPVLADPPRLERVFLNLLSNAIKFSEKGANVEVAVAEMDGQVVISVVDHGIGIPADEISHLFTRFFRSRNAEKHAIQGTGLGLTIVADIVARHAGTIDVDSVEGEGTTMTVRLPVADSTHSSDKEPSLSVGL